MTTVANYIQYAQNEVSEKRHLTRQWVSHHPLTTHVPVRVRKTSFLCAKDGAIGGRDLSVIDDSVLSFHFDCVGVMIDY